jgi:cytidyltransferase-like protein
VQQPVSLAELAQDVVRRRTDKPRPTIGITNGCYDLLHPGHVAMLEEAASLCDLLVVGVDSDARVATLKGEGRPFLPWPDRCSILGGLRAVWRIVGLDTADSLCDVMQRIRPDRYFCRADEAVPERAEAERLHIFVMALERHGPWSSTGQARTGDRKNGRMAQC